MNDNVHQGVDGRSTMVTATITNDRATADGTTMAVGGGALTLTDDEPLPEVTLALSSTSITESSGVSTVTATLSGVSSEAVTVTVGGDGRDRGGGRRLRAVERDDADDRGGVDDEFGDGDGVGGGRHDGRAGRDGDGLVDGLGRQRGWWRRRARR